jgi:hypothetical protein
MRAPLLAAALLVAAALYLPARAACRETPAAEPAAPVARVKSGGDAIPLIRTARGLTTMISLPEEAREAICGDLYDPDQNAGGFVVQRSGRDIFVKPLRAAGRSNLFVKTGRATYAFDLAVVEQPSAMRIVYVDGAGPQEALEAAREALARERTACDEARTAAADELARLRADLERAAGEPAPEAASRAGEEAFAEALAHSLANGGMARVLRAKARGSGLEILLGAAMLTAGGRSFLPCTLRNLTPHPVVVATAELGPAGRRATLNAVVPPAASRAVVIAFDDPAPARGPLSLLDASGAPLLTVRPFE